VGVVYVYEIEKEEWRQLFIDHFRYNKLPKYLHYKIEVRQIASHFIFFQDTFYRCFFNGVFLCCHGKEESTKALEKTHSRICEAH